MARYTTGKHNIWQALTIERQDPRITVDPPWNNGSPSQTQRHAGVLYGTSMTETVLAFDTAIGGQLIKTEGFGSSAIGHFWNQNNTAGDTGLSSLLCASVRDIGVDGRAEFRPYPYVYNQWWTDPDVHGPDMLTRADGICLQGAASRVNDVLLYNIPGTAVKIRDGKVKNNDGTSTQAGFYGMFDMPFTIVDGLHVKQAINGLDIQSGDAKLQNIYIDNCAKTGLIIDVANGYLDRTHIQGADIACDVISQVRATNCYHESARIGTRINSSAHGCDFTGLDIGPGTCRETGLLMQSNGCYIRLRGSVSAGTVGVKDYGHGNDTKANLTVKSGATGVQLYGGNGGTLDLSTYQPSSGTAVEVATAIKNWVMRIRCQGDGGTPVALKLTAGITNCKIDITKTGSITPTIVGSWGSGNTITIDGVVQTSP